MISVQLASIARRRWKWIQKWKGFIPSWSGNVQLVINERLFWFHSHFLKFVLIGTIGHPRAGGSQEAFWGDSSVWFKQQGSAPPIRWWSATPGFTNNAKRTRNCTQAFSTRWPKNDRQVRQVNSCYADIASPNFYFATKTSYKFIKNTNIDLITLPGIIQVKSNH